MTEYEFKELISTKGNELFRPMPWRTDTRPYYVLVSELMLQQTQVQRVMPKFEEFISAYPDERSLAAASLADVLVHWQGLGYNRRAKFLHESAKRIMSEFGGVFPRDPANILRLPGVGKNTLGAVQAYAFNTPAIFIETNIRTVYMHHFFDEYLEVDDAMIIEKLRQTIDDEHPRDFYWALMDYGSWLKANGVRNVSRSSHYKKQSALEGSVRQVRGHLIKALVGNGLTDDELRRAVHADGRYDRAIAGLMGDGLITQSEEGVYHLTK